MIRPPPRSTRTYTRFPYTTLFRSTENGPYVERELALVKVAGHGDQRIEALRLADVYRARVVAATIDSFIFEITGGSEKVGKFINLLRHLSLVEVARTRIVGLRWEGRIGGQGCVSTFRYRGAPDREKN